MEWWHGVDLDFPQKDTIHVVLSTLNDTDQTIQTLKCEFTDDNFIETQRLRDKLLIGIETGNIYTFDFRDSCRDLEKHNQCFEFLLQCISGQQQQKTKKFQFQTWLPLTVAEADKLSAAITSNDNINHLGFFDDGRQDGMFHEEGTFEVIFEAVLNTATINRLSLYLTASSFRRIVERDCFGTSSLSTNVTLRNLILGTHREQEIQQNVAYKDEGMKQLTNVLKFNKGLRFMSFHGDTIAKAGLEYLVDSMQYNSTLLEINFSFCDPIKNEEEKEEQIVLQTQIDALVQVNKFWDRCNRKHIKARRGDKRTNMDMIPVNVYPNLLLVKFTNKPLVLFLLLQKQNPVLFGAAAEQARRAALQEEVERQRQREAAAAKQARRAALQEEEERQRQREAAAAEQARLAALQKEEEECQLQREAEEREHLKAQLAALREEVRAQEEAAAAKSTKKKKEASKPVANKKKKTTTSDTDDKAVAGMSVKATTGKVSSKKRKVPQEEDDASLASSAKKKTGSSKVTGNVPAILSMVSPRKKRKVVAIKPIDDKNRWYHVVYNDGDEEDFEDEEIDK